MAKYLIRQGSHRALPLSFGLFIGKKSMTRKVIFHSDCRCDLGNDNQYDWNKLFGVGYLWSPHTDSARFGWRYNKQNDVIEIGAYAYVSGERTMNYIGSVPLEQECTLSLIISKKYYDFSLQYDGGTAGIGDIIPKTTNKLFSYKMGLYFGGDEVAPHDMHVTIDKP